MIKIAPSLLSADFSRLESEIQDIVLAGADYLHIDVMDGSFVPNISFGFPIIQSIRGVSDIFFDTHLMIDRPVRYVERFCKCGSDLVNIHVEADTPENIHKALQIIKNNGKQCGITLKPCTSADAVSEYLDEVDLILVMTVEPGFGGQSFMTDQLPKITEIRKMIDSHHPSIQLEVDGGINTETAKMAVEAGCDILVAGSSVFGKNDRKAAVESLKMFG